MKFITTSICPLFAPIVLRASIVDSDAINSHQEELIALLLSTGENDPVSANE